MFELSPHIDKNKIFLVNLSEIEGRLDCGYYEPQKLKKIKLLKKHSSSIKLRNVIIRLQTGFNNNQNNSNNGIKFIRTQNIRPINLDLTQTTFTTDDKIRISKYGDILFTRIGVNVGDVAFNDYGDFAISDNVILASLDNPVLAKYISIVLSTEVGKNILNREKRDTARPIISYENIKNIQIPIFNQEIQQKIIDLYETAYNEKQQKEAEAERLLTGIDDYLLGELGIKLPEKDNSLKNRMFKVNFSEVTGGRFDAYYYQTYFKKNIVNIKNGNYETTILKNIIEGNLIKGKLPNNDEKKGENKVIQIGSIDNNGNIDFENLLTAKNIFSEEQKLKKNDVIIVITGATIGKISFWDYESDYYLGGDLVKFQTKENINPFYIFSILRTKPYQIEIERNVTGATNGHLSPTDIERFSIPIPPLEKQNEIAEHIKAIREQAKQLKTEAKQVLEQAKQEVEKMILGE